MSAKVIIGIGLVVFIIFVDYVWNKGKKQRR